MVKLIFIRRGYSIKATGVFLLGLLLALLKLGRHRYLLQQDPLVSTVAFLYPVVVLIWPVLNKGTPVVIVVIPQTRALGNRLGTYKRWPLLALRFAGSVRGSISTLLLVIIVSSHKFYIAIFGNAIFSNSPLVGALTAGLHQVPALNRAQSLRYLISPLQLQALAFLYLGGLPHLVLKLHALLGGDYVIIHTAAVYTRSLQFVTAFSLFLIILLLFFEAIP